MLTALAIYAGIASTLSLVLTFRLASQTGQPDLVPVFSSGPPVGSAAPALPIPPGAVPGPTAVPRLVAFVSTTCPGCLRSIPRLHEAIGASELSRDDVVAVVVGPENATCTELRRELEDVALILREDDNGPICLAYEVESFPSYVLTEAGTVVATAHAPEELSLTTPALSQ